LSLSEYDSGITNSSTEKQIAELEKKYKQEQKRINQKIINIQRDAEKKAK
jgi:hypothetical protein